MSNSQINQEYDVHPEIKKHLAPESSSVQEEPTSASTPAEPLSAQSAGDLLEIQEEVPQPVAQTQETEQNKHFKKLRQQAYKAERERDELARRLKEIEESQKQQQYTAQPSYSTDDDVNQRMAYLEQQILQSRIAAQCPDFDSVVSPENIAALKREHPDIAASLSSSKDLYAMALSTYKMIKTFGIADTSNEMNYNKQRLLENSNKPRSTSSISPQRGESPLAKANDFAQGLTPELKGSLYKQMKDAQRNG